MLYIEHAGLAETFLVADCAGDAEARRWMAHNNILVEVDYKTAVRWDMVGRGAQIAIVELKGDDQRTIN